MRDLTQYYKNISKDIWNCIQFMGHTSAGRGICGTDLVGCVTSLDTVVSRGFLAWVQGRPSIRVTRPRLTFPRRRKPSPRVWLSSEELDLSPSGWVVSFLKECRRGLRHFGGCRACLGYGPTPGPTLKGLVPHSSLFGGVCDKYCLLHPGRMIQLYFTVS